MSDEEHVRFLADENFRQAIVVQLRKKNPQIDIMTAAEAGILGAPDPQVLAHAASAGRILMSHDVTTIPGYFAELLMSGAHSPGVFLIAQTTPVGEAIAAFLLVWSASTADEWRDQLTFLPF